MIGFLFAKPMRPRAEDDCVFDTVIDTAIDIAAPADRGSGTNPR